MHNITFLTMLYLFFYLIANKVFKTSGEVIDRGRNPGKSNRTYISKCLLHYSVCIILHFLPCYMFIAVSGNSILGEVVGGARISSRSLQYQHALVDALFLTSSKQL